ncbi:TadE/TadG family type IV pilus assembly protein [Pseudohalocynthiibacter aestuariivivens]|jgi:TadE-like protein|uniref:TadE/TadG family type IV pilus assembly protein n=1 Tax=Pseudohalocynthiibacter aestuariivivens TaxID=1591409 RepID=A0ABV5JF45_9RHOB|nr:MULTISPECIES: TadE/TadG family type IV pilus assembly protein [Pseudohalocynthiibacter]MBS9717900.1 pilus assembly protein [Pseudohalocynthiibacter aestuariivivens]MCK0102951.1 pilus assembly protein [Pseudohalocynthiibacter sp. F2068]
MNLFTRLIRRFRRSEKGNATIEFVLVFPIFIYIFMSAFESGLLAVRHVMLERALDLTVRDLRLGNLTGPTHDELKTLICNRATILPDCMNALQLELRPVSTTTWSPLGSNATCVDRSGTITPVVAFDGGGDNEMMLVRACAIFDPIFTGNGMGFHMRVDHTGGYALVSTSAFVNEPRS